MLFDVRAYPVRSRRGGIPPPCKVGVFLESREHRGHLLGTSLSASNFSSQTPGESDHRLPIRRVRRWRSLVQRRGVPVSENGPRDSLRTGVNSLRSNYI